MSVIRDSDGSERQDIPLNGTLTNGGTLGPMTPGKGHWCEFCQTYHSSMSCFHPGGRAYYAMKQRAEAAEAEVERQQRGDGSTYYENKILSLKAEVEEAWACVEGYKQTAQEEREEVEKLTWMLREVYGDWVDGESYESWLADLAHRWEER